MAISDAQIKRLRATSAVATDKQMSRILPQICDVALGNLDSYECGYLGLGTFTKKRARLHCELTRQQDKWPPVEANWGKDEAIAQDINALKANGWKEVKLGNVRKTGQIPNRVKLLNDAADSLEAWLRDYISINYISIMQPRDVADVKAQIAGVRRTAADLVNLATALQRLL